MAYHRRLGAEDGTVLAACSICGTAFRFPTELRYCNDGLFRCNVFCTEKTTEVDYARQQMGRALRDEMSLPFPVGVPPWWSMTPPEEEDDD